MSYLLFAGEFNSSCGGMGDYQGRHDTIENALNSADTDYDWLQVVEHETMNIVKYIEKRRWPYTI